MFKVDIPPDPKEMAAIELRRQREAERLRRIQDPRQLRMGKDVDALQQQIAEREAMKQAEKERLEAEAKHLNWQDRMLQIMDKKQREAAKQRESETMQYRKEYQKPESSSEYDLNNPHTLRMEQSLADNIDNLGPSSLQKFDGEDPDYAVRTQRQGEQRVQWVQEQMQEKERQRQEEDERRQLEEKILADQIRYTALVEEAEKRAREKATQETKKTNIDLLDTSRERSQQQKLEEQQKYHEHVMTQVNSELLSEDPATAFGEDGKIKDTKGFKGFLPSQLEEIRRTQLEQVKELEERKKQETARIAEEEKQQKAVARAMLLAEREAARRRKEAQRQVMQDNNALANTQRTERRNSVEKVSVGDDFFSQFGTSSR